MYRPYPAHPLKITRPVVISLLLHVALFASLAIVPGLRLPISEKPMRVTWVELPKGTSEDIDINIKKSEGMPKSTIEEQKNAPIPEQPPKQEPLVATKPPEAQKLAEAKKTEVPRPKMEITDKNVKVRRAEQPPKSPSDRKIQNALAKIDQQLKDRTVVPEAAQVKESGGGYKYGTSDKPLRVSPSDPEYLKYQAMLRYKIMREWIVPATYAEGSGSDERQGRGDDQHGRRGRVGPVGLGLRKRELRPVRGPRRQEGLALSQAPRPPRLGGVQRGIPRRIRPAHEGPVLKNH